MKANNKRMKRIERVEGLIKQASEIQRFLNMLVWGRQKSGKTGLIGSGPNPIVLACEDGTQTIQDYPDIQVFPVDERGHWVPPRWQHASDFLYYLRYADHDRQTVGIDTTTALLRMGVRFINKDEEVRDEFRAKGTTDQRTWGRVNGLLIEYMEDMASVCAERGMNLIWTAQERALGEDQALQAGSPFVPDLTPQVRGAILSQPSIIARTVIEEDMEGDIENTDLKYGMVFKHAEWPVGVRESIIRKSGKFPAKAYNVTIPKLVRKINATKEVKSGESKGKKQRPNRG